MELILVVVISAGMAGNSQHGVSRSLSVKQRIVFVIQSLVTLKTNNKS